MQQIGAALEEEIIIMERFRNHFHQGIHSEPVSAPALDSVETENYVIENGILISYKVISDVCVIPEGVTELKSFAINYDRSKIKEIILPSTIRYIRENNFSSCKNLERINFPEGLLEIEDNALESCYALKEVSLPASLRKIGNRAFSCCEGLEHVCLKEGIREIGESAFSSNKSLKELQLPGTIRVVGKKAFAFCDDLEQVSICGGVYELGTEAFMNCSKLTQISFEDGLRIIGERAFWGTALKTLVLPKRLVSIGNYAFAWCRHLSSIHMPDSPAQMGNYIFAHCENIQHWNVPPELLTPRFVVKNSVLEETICMVDLEEIVLPEGIVKIASKSIHNRAKRIVLPKSLRTIGKYAFDYCAVESVVIPDGVEEIEAYAFDCCDDLKEINLPDSIHTLGSNAFSGCRKLQSVKLPTKITKMESNVFKKCESLEDIEIPTGVTEIGYEAFSNCKKLNRVVLPEGLEEIDFSAFQKCGSLKEVNLPSTVKRISLGAFSGCSALQEVCLPDGLEELWENAFSGCRAIREVMIPMSIKELKSGVFSGCTQLRRVVIPTSVQTVSRYAFTGCVNLEQVECEAPERFEAALLDTPYWKNTYGESIVRKRLPLELVGDRSGKLLNDLGYSLFDPERSYNIRLPGEDGIVEVCSYVSEDDPDEDGFGSEIYYDWWLLDEELKMIPGIPMWHNHSNLDMRNHEQEWNSLRTKAAQIIKDT